VNSVLNVKDDVKGEFCVYRPNAYIKLYTHTFHKLGEMAIYLRDCLLFYVPYSLIAREFDTSVGIITMPTCQFWRCFDNEKYRPTELRLHLLAKENTVKIPRVADAYVMTNVTPSYGWIAGNSVCLSGCELGHPKPVELYS